MKIDIPVSILKTLRAIKKVEGFLLTGSRVLGKHSKNADWDFHVILKKGTPRWRKTWKVDNHLLEIFCNDVNEIKKDFESDQKGGRGVNIFMFTTGQIIVDNKKNDLQRLQSQAKRLWEKGPNRLSKNDISFIGYDIAMYIHDLEDLLHDKNPALLLVNYAVNEFVRYYYRLSHIWLPRPNDRLQDLSKRSPKTFKMVDKINLENKWEEKVRLAIRLGKMLGENFKLTLDGSLYIPPAKNDKGD